MAPKTSFSERQNCCSESWESAISTCNHFETLKGVSDKSLTRQGRKQATATKLGIYSTFTTRSSIHFVARCSNFCKPQKKFRSLSVQPGLGGNNDLSVGRKMTNFQLFFQSREQVVVRRGQIRRMGWVIKTLRRPGRSVSSGLQVPDKPGHCRARTRPPWWPSRCRYFSFKMSFHRTSWDE